MSTEKTDRRRDSLSYVADADERAALKAKNEDENLRDALKLIRRLVTSGYAPDDEIDKELVEAWSKAK